MGCKGGRADFGAVRGFPDEKMATTRRRGQPVIRNWGLKNGLRFDQRAVKHRNGAWPLHCSLLDGVRVGFRQLAGGPFGGALKWDQRFGAVKVDDGVKLRR